MPELASHPRKPLRIWKAPDPEHFYSVGVDVAEGDDSQDSDFSAICVVDCATLEQVAEYQTKQLDPYELADKVNAIGTYYGGKAGQAHVIVEVNNHGLSTILRLKNDLAYWNLFSRKMFDHSQFKYVNKVGWSTTAMSRPLLVNYARQALRTNPAIIRSRPLFSEMGAFVFTERNKGEARPGEHDDLVFAWMLAIYGRDYSHWTSEEERDGEVPEEEDHPDKWVWKALDQKVIANQRRDDPAAWEEPEPVFMNYKDMGYY